jgi:hypothetical protein
MEKKPPNTGKPFIKNLNKNYDPELLKDENRISEIMSEFIQGELEKINLKLQSNEVLNFRDQLTNQTLIHAILRNESPNITEENKLQIIKKLVSEKNVSINTMTNYNQNALHLACQNGYNLIIDYLIEKNCNQSLIDNYGNAPIHYLVDKFIKECGQNDFYLQSNIEIKSKLPNQIKKINDILKHQNLLELIKNEEVINIIDPLKKFIKYKTQLCLPLIYEIIKDKKAEIIKINSALSESTKIKQEREKNIIINSINDIRSIYGFKDDFANIEWDDFLKKQNIKIIKNKEIIKKKILSTIENTTKLIEQNRRTIDDELMYFFNILMSYMSGIYFLYYSLYKLVDDNLNIDLYDGINDNIIKNSEIYNNIDFFRFIIENLKNEINKLLLTDLKIFLNGIGEIDNIGEIYMGLANFENKIKYELYEYDDELKTTNNIIFYCKNDANILIQNKEIKNNNRNVAADNYMQYINRYNDNDNENEPINDIFIYEKEKETDNKYFKFTPIRIIISVIDKMFIEINNRLQNIINSQDFQKEILNFDLFYIKYLTELIFKIINNLIILEKYLNDINIAELDDIKNNILTLYYNNNNNDNDIIKQYDYIMNKINIPNNFNKKLNNKDSIFKDLYSKCIDIINNFKEIINDINDYLSYDQLEKYNIFNQDNTNPQVINNTIFNNYSFNLNIPTSYTEYKNNFFIINYIGDIYLLTKNNLIDSNIYKKNYIEKICKYANTSDYNKFYITNKVIEYLQIKIELNNEYYDIETTEVEFNINNNQEYKRGYDILEKENENMDNIEIKEENNILCENKEIIDSDNKIVSWIIEDNFLINKDLKSYIITKNLNELINIFVHLIYVNIENKPLITIKDDNEYKLDKANIKNINNTLEFIGCNPKEKQNYLIENIINYIKIIINKEIDKEIFKIIDEIKKNNVEIENNFKELLSKNIYSLTPSSTLESLEILKFKNKNKFIPEQNKIIDSKCLNKNKIDELLDIKMDYKVLDSNGNTILIRLIEQFNIYGIEKLINKNELIGQLLKTYKNNNMETPIDYLNNCIKNIQNEYTQENFKYRINRYSIVLENSLKSNSEFDNISLENSSDLIYQILSNSIYLFNEVMWLKNYEYPSGWEIKDKNNLKKILKINEEKLLINSFTNIENENNLELNKFNNLQILQNEICELQNKIKQLNYEYESNNIFISKSDISGNIIEINNKIILLEKQLTELKNKKIENKKFDITNTISKYDNLLFDIENTTIKWDEYKKLINGLDDKYLGILKILNNKCEKSELISNFLINIYNNTKDENFDLIEKYYKLIYDKIFANYWDLDRYDDSDYNIINKSIIKILKINVIGIIKNELINTLINYIIEIFNYTKLDELKELIKNSDELNKSIEKYLYICLIEKLELKNPEKIYFSIDNLKNNILGILETIINNKLDENEKSLIFKIIEFNKFLCENIGLNCYDEIKKILYDGKKISMYYKIKKILK